MGPALLTLVLAVLPAVAAAAEPPALDLRGWSFAGHSENTVMFIRPEAPPPGSAHRRVLVRFEEAEPFDENGFASMSNVEINDIDCTESRTRVIQDTRYAEPNLQGQARVDRPVDPAWQSEAPGSFGAGIIEAACGRAAPPAPAPG